MFFTPFTYSEVIVETIPSWFITVGAYPAAINIALWVSLDRIEEERLVRYALTPQLLGENRNISKPSFRPGVGVNLRVVRTTHLSPLRYDKYTIEDIWCQDPAKEMFTASFS